MTSPVRDVDLDCAPPAPVAAVLALGSNLGDRLTHLQAAVSGLARETGVHAVAVSPVVETAPVGGPEQADYLNAVLLVRCRLSPRALLAACQRVEAQQGRERTVRWGARTLDVDVITVDGLLSSADDLTLPHPRAHERAFVLAPWAQLDPQATVPGPDGGSVALLASQAPDRAGVHPRPDLVLWLPSSSGGDDDAGRFSRPDEAGDRAEEAGERA